MYFIIRQGRKVLLTFPPGQLAINLTNKQDQVLCQSIRSSMTEDTGKTMPGGVYPRSAGT